MNASHDGTIALANSVGSCISTSGKAFVVNVGILRFFFRIAIKLSFKLELSSMSQVKSIVVNCFSGLVSHPDLNQTWNLRR